MALATLLHRLGAGVARHPRAVIAAWLLAIALAVPTALGLPPQLDKSDALITGSDSARAMQLLADRFANPFTEPIVVVLHGDNAFATDNAFAASIAHLAATLRALPAVAHVVAPTDPGADPRLTGADGHTALLLVGPRKGAGRGREAVGPTRAAVADAVNRFAAVDPTFYVATTGTWPFASDIVARTNEASGQAERLVLLPALLLLLVVFAAPVAAALPVALGVIATVVACGLAAVVARFVPLNALVPTAISMLGLALGIDYCLLMVGRFREYRRAGATPEAAAADTVATAGWTVTTAGAVVMVTLAVLLPLGLIDAVSVGVGGVLVVLTTVTLALTLLPALLVLSARWLDWPRAVAPRPLPPYFAWWASMVARFRWPLLLGSLAILVTLALPALRFRGGVPDVRWYPQDLEAVRGSQMLAAMGRGGLTFPVQVVVAAKDGAVLAPAGVRKLLAVSRALHQDKRVGEVVGPVDLRAGLAPLHYALLYAHPDQAIARHPEIARLFLSEDRQLAYMQVLVAQGTTLAEAKGLVREIRMHSDGQFDVMVGGLVAINVDYEGRLRQAMPWVVGTVFGLTALLLAVAFRSVMVPLKAIALNVLAVGAAIGCSVAVFQEGTAHTLVGLDGAMGSLPMLVPLLIFCLTFGLSMDYELFMLSRIREARATAPDEATAIGRGLAESGGVITAAALIMGLVFGAFVTVDMIFVKLLGFGLVVAIFLEATLIRLVLAPALLNVAGRWNWWPGDKG